MLYVCRRPDHYLHTRRVVWTVNSFLSLPSLPSLLSFWALPPEHCTQKRSNCFHLAKYIRHSVRLFGLNSRHDIFNNITLLASSHRRPIPHLSFVSAAEAAMMKCENEKKRRRRRKTSLLDQKAIICCSRWAALGQRWIPATHIKVVKNHYAARDLHRRHITGPSTSSSVYGTFIVNLDKFWISFFSRFFLRPLFVPLSILKRRLFSSISFIIACDALHMTPPRNYVCASSKRPPETLLTITNQFMCTNGVRVHERKSKTTVCRRRRNGPNFENQKLSWIPECSSACGSGCSYTVTEFIQFVSFWMAMPASNYNGHFLSPKSTICFLLIIKWKKNHTHENITYITFSSTSACIRERTSHTFTRVDCERVAMDRNILCYDAANERAQCALLPTLTPPTTTRKSWHTSTV